MAHLNHDSNATRPTVLLVDDLEDNLFVFSEVLKREGFNVLTAQSGKQALEVLTKNIDLVDLVLSDVMMPGMTGFELCKIIKKDQILKEVPVILMTAQLMDDEHAVEGLQYGADDYISRPVNPSLLTSKIQTVLERKAAADKWKKKSEETREELEVKEWHTRMLIHDLRTPLTSAMGFLSILAMDEELKDRHREIIAKVQHAIQKESELLEDMLMLTAARENRLHLDVEEFDLSCQVQEVLFLEEGTASRKGIRLEKGLVEQDLVVRADRRLIGRVLTNLLDNAIRHAPDNSTITIHAFRHPSPNAPFPIERAKEASIICAIKNLGIPIPREVKEKIFDPFVRRKINKSNACRYGVGLGLSFCKEIIRAHRGTIHLLSPIPQKKEGAIFYFMLPSLNAAH